MDIVWLPDATTKPRRLAVGEFDGVHIGHREVIRDADAVLTFEPHPRTVVAPASAPKLLTTLEQKADLIAAVGVEELIVIPFDGSFAAQTAQEFIDHVLVAHLDARHVSVGENFRFGNKARGDAALLASQDKFETRVTELVELDGEIVSSTHIRGLVATGQVADAARALGAPFGMRGVDAHSDGRELRLDFIARLRGEKRFDSVDALVEQMHRDVDETREIVAAA